MLLLKAFYYQYYSILTRKRDVHDFFRNWLLCQGHYFSKLVRLLNFFCFMATKNHSRRISWRLVIWNTHLYIPNQAMIIMFPSRPYSEVRVRNLYNLRSGTHVRERKKYVWRVKLKSVMGAFFFFIFEQVRVRVRIKFS